MTAVAFPKPVKVKRKRKPLRAKRWGIKPRRPRRLDRPDANPEHLEWCRLQRCAAREHIADAGPCGGIMEAAHEGAKKPGIGLKSPDELAIPLCSRHHSQWTRHRGVFRMWSRDRRREWGDEMGALARSRFLSHGSRRSS